MSASNVIKNVVSVGVGMFAAILGYEALECSRKRSRRINVVAVTSDSIEGTNAIAFEKKPDGTGRASSSTNDKIDEFSETQDGKSFWSKLRPSWFFVSKEKDFKEEAPIVSAETHESHNTNVEEGQDVIEKNGYDELVEAYEEAAKTYRAS